MWYHNPKKLLWRQKIEWLRKCTEFWDLPAMIQKNSFFLRLLAINIDQRNKKKIPITSHMFALLISGAYYYVYLVSVIWCVFLRKPALDKISAVIVFSLGVASEISAFKLIYMYIYRNTIVDIVARYLALNSSVIPGSRMYENLKKSLKIIKKRAVIFWIVIIFNGISYAGKPLVVPGRHLMEDSLIVYGLEPVFESPNYQIAFTLTAMGIFFTTYLTSNISALLIILIGYTESYMLAMSTELVHLWQDANIVDQNRIINGETDDKGRKHRVQKYIRNKLTEVIKDHTIHIDLIRKIETVFRGALAVEFIMLSVSLIAELLGGLENTYIQLPFALMSVAIDCLMGQKLMDACDAFDIAVYNCKWEYFDISNMKVVLLMLKNSKKSLKISAGGVTTLSFTSLMSVFKSIYSAYSTLRVTMN